MRSTRPLICVPVCERSLDAVEQAFKDAEQTADVIEIRFDCIDTSQLQQAVTQIAGLCASSRKATIATYRPAEQGGYRQLSIDERVNFWTSSKLDNFAYLDIESDLLTNDLLCNHTALANTARVICSYHDFHGMPSDIGRLYERIAAMPARFLKIAIQARDVTDCVPAFALLERGVKENRELIPIAMGTAGVATRILGPSRGAFLSYASIDENRGTAPGQLTVQDLRETYRIDQINRATKIFGVVGRPIGHSISPVIHNAAFGETAYDGVYIPFEVKDISGFMRRMVHPRSREIDWNLAGLSVTAPHKISVMPHLDQVEPQARSIGAVNTVFVDGDILSGYNTDADGFLDGLRTKLDVIEGTRCAVIGTGGVARAVVWALTNAGAGVTVISREQSRAAALAGEFDATGDALNDTKFDGFDLVVNATKLGGAGEFIDQTLATVDQLRGARFAYDLVYNPIETRFLRDAREAGCETIDGLTMFIAQAVRQFELWTGREAPRGVMVAAANAALQNRER